MVSEDSDMKHGHRAVVAVSSNQTDDIEVAEPMQGLVEPAHLFQSITRDPFDGPNSH
jgi:hypothetical protein